MRRAGVVLGLVAVSTVLAGCASADHSWSGEFDARLEGAAATVEEAREEVHPHMSPDEYATIFWPLGSTLFFKSELVAKLNPPTGCEALQVKGKAAVYRASSLLGGLFENLTPGLERDLPHMLEEDLAKLEKLEGEAATCAKS
jgi:hypothetical protein